MACKQCKRYEAILSKQVFASVKMLCSIADLMPDEGKEELAKAVESAMKPTDPEDRALLWELVESIISEHVVIVSRNEPTMRGS